MKTTHEDKALAGFTAAQRAAYEHATRGAAMSAAERDAVGRALILEAEARVHDDPLRRKLAGIRPTADEVKAIASAEAAYEAAVAKRVRARIVAVQAEQAARLRRAGALRVDADPVLIGDIEAVSEGRQLWCRTHLPPSTTPGSPAP